MADTIDIVQHSISHDRRDESIEAKARWFQSLTLAERMELLCEFTDLALALSPELARGRSIEVHLGRIQVLCLETHEQERKSST